MATEKIAWVRPGSLNSGFCILPDGFEMRRRAAEAKGYKVVTWPKAERVAMPHPHEPDMVVLPRGQVMSLDTARSAGFTVSTRLPNADPNSEWRSAILSSPEARHRASATVELVTTQSPTTMTAESARAFLRGLPVEANEEDTTMTTNASANPERAARLAEIEGSMKAYNKSQGHAARASATPHSSLAGVEQTKLRRLAEIRLNALENGTAHEASSNETKKLRYALSVTGMALSDVFAQLNLDTSKLRA